LISQLEGKSYTCNKKVFFTMMTRILTVFFSLVALVLGSFLVYSIWDEIEQEKRIARAEKAVIRKLEMIRDAEIAFRNAHGHYTENWDSLMAFVDTGKIYIIQKREEIFTLDYGADSVVTHFDTLGSVGVIDSLFKEEKYPNFQLNRLPYLPNSDKKFAISAGKIEKGGLKVDVIEVVDVMPADPKRKESNDLRNQKPLRFGAMDEVTTAGNWE
jgi:hypothetical protein